MGNLCKNENCKDRQDETYVSFWIKDKGGGVWDFKGEIGNLQVEKGRGGILLENSETRCRGESVERILARIRSVCHPLLTSAEVNVVRQS